MNISASSARPIVFIPRTDLRTGYQESLDQMQHLGAKIVLSATLCPSLSLIWAKATSQKILRSPVSLSLLLFGAGCTAHQSLEYRRMSQYTHLSLVLDENGPTNSGEMNQKLRKIFQESNAKISYHPHGIFVTKDSGTDSAIERAKKSIASMKRVEIPSCVLNTDTDLLVKATSDRWLARLMFPLSVLILVMRVAEQLPTKNKKIMDKKPDKKPDDYLVNTAAAYHIYDYLSGPSVSEVRGNLTSHLNQCSSVKSLPPTIIRNDMIDSGSMSFLNKWAGDMKSVGVRVDRTGNLILYRDKQQSFGGPYPLHRFPAK